MQRPAGPQLPSIRSLHPYLPPPAAMDPTPSTSTSNYMQTSSHAGAQGDRYPPSSYAGSEADGDERDAAADNEPPKKKRRRQALSCTECKRRKIRCDRTQPCGPCVKRGDQAKCQWHVVEPAILIPSSSAEKYVPRSEYDILRGRVDTLEERVNAFQDYIYHLPPQVLASHPLPPGLIPLPPTFNTEGQGFDPRHSPSYTPGSGPSSRPVFLAPGSFPSHTGGSGGDGPFAGGIAPSQTQTQPHSRAASSSLSPTQRRASFSPTRTTMPPSTTQRQRSDSQHGHPDSAPPPLGTVAPSDIHQDHRAISPAHVRGRRSASFSSTHPTSPISAASQGGQWGERFRSFPPASQTFSGSAGDLGSGGGAHGSHSGGIDTAPSFPSFPAHAGPRDISSAPSRTHSTAAASSPVFGPPSLFSPPLHAPNRIVSTPSSAFSGSFSSTAISGAGSSAGRSSAGSLSSFISSSGSAPESASSFSSATPTTESPYSATLSTGQIPPPFPGDPGLYQHGPVHGSDGAVPTHALARIVRPEVVGGVTSSHANVKRAREDVAPKNRSAQAPQGARLRVSLSAPCNRPLLRSARPLVRRHTPSTTPAMRTRAPRLERQRPIPATRREAGVYVRWMSTRSRHPRRRCRLLVRPPRSARLPLGILCVPAPNRTHPRTSPEGPTPGGRRRAGDE
ncbi:hypothetical protein C8R45DRAFT_144507 [Mycena sanguinolenta]|nr:hypothetical protein C8R45DRAFT_144507 [Mycena sanguinolenta]